MALDFGPRALFNPDPQTQGGDTMTTKLGQPVRKTLVAIGAIAALAALSGSASAHWHGGCWGCGAFAAGAIAGAALSSPYVAPRYYYGGPVVAPGYGYPVCPLYGPRPYYCR
jgi:hypothetical protein